MRLDQLDRKDYLETKEPPAPKTAQFKVDYRHAAPDRGAVGVAKAAQLNVTIGIIDL